MDESDVTDADAHILTIDIPDDALERAADGDDSIGLIVNRGPKVVMSQRGRDVPLQQGEATLVQESASLTHGNVRYYGLALARPVLAARMSNLDASMMRAIPRSGNPLGLLVNYLDLIRKEADLSLPEVRRCVVRHIHDLTALAFGANRNAKEEGLSAVAAAHLAAVLAHIAESFAEPGLIVETVARRQGISSRYLQQLLEASGKSFTARVNELRLQKVFALLTNEHHGKRRISDIALEAGFSDISHFNRLFRARFGDTPRGAAGTPASARNPRNVRSHWNGPGPAQVELAVARRSLFALGQKRTSGTR